MPFPVRFDFDVQAPTDGRHPRVHAPLGQFDGCGLAVTAPLGPAAFIDFVLRHFYGAAVCDFAHSPSVGHEVFDRTITDQESGGWHLVAPS